MNFFEIEELIKEFKVFDLGYLKLKYEYFELVLDKEFVYVKKSVLNFVYFLVFIMVEVSMLSV